MAKEQTKEQKKELYSFLHPHRRRVQTPMPEGSIVQSEFAKEADINYLVEKHVRAGIPFPTQTLQDFRDVSGAVDFQAAQDIIIKARETWYALDPKIRRHFGDLPQNFLSALEDPERHEELIRLKVIKRPEEPQKPAGSVAPKGTQGVPEPKAKGGSETPGTGAT